MTKTSAFKPASDVALMIKDKKELMKSSDAMIDKLVDDLQNAGIEISRLRQLLEDNGIDHEAK